MASMKHSVVLGFLLILIASLVRVGTAQEDGDAFTPAQQALIAQVEAATADMRTWRTFKELRIESLEYTERVNVDAETAIIIQQFVDSTINSIYDSNPMLSNDYNSDNLLTVQVQTQNDFGEDRQVSDTYVLTVNARYFADQLYVRGLYTGPPNASLEDALSSWQEITSDPEQFPLLQSANLFHFLPEPPSDAGINPLLAVDFVRLLREPSWRDVILDIELLERNQVILNGNGAEVTTDQLRIVLDPLKALGIVFTENDARTDLVTTFSNDLASVELLLWIDSENFRRVLEKYVIVFVGEPDPLIFGYGENDIEEEGSLTIEYRFESDILFADINIPLMVQDPTQDP